MTGADANRAGLRKSAGDARRTGVGGVEPRHLQYAPLPQGQGGCGIPQRFRKACAMRGASGVSRRRSRTEELAERVDFVPARGRPFAGVACYRLGCDVRRAAHCAARAFVDLRAARRTGRFQDFAAMRAVPHAPGRHTDCRRTVEKPSAQGVWNVRYAGERRTERGRRRPRAFRRRRIPLPRPGRRRLERYAKPLGKLLHVFSRQLRGIAGFEHGQRRLLASYLAGKHRLRKPQFPPGGGGTGAKIYGQINHFVNSIL